MKKSNKTKSVDKKIINKNITDEKISKGIDILNQHKEKLNSNREERIGKTLNEVIDEYQMQEEKSQKNSVLKKIIRALIILLIVLIVYLFFYYGPVFGFSIYKDTGISEDKKIDFATTDQDIYKMYNQEFLIYSNAKLSTYNSNAKKTWEYTFSEQFTPQIYIEGKYMVVTNNSNGTIYLFENKQEILDKKIDGTIQNIYLDSNGNMAIEYSTSGYKKVIGVFTKNGKNLYNAYLSSGSIIDIKLTSDAKKLIVLQSTTNSFKVGFKVISIDGTKTENNTSEIAKFDDNLMYDLTIQNQNLIILLDDSIVKLNTLTGEKTVIKDFSSSQIIFIGILDSYYSLIEKKLDENSNGYVLQNNRLDNSSICSLQLDNSPKFSFNTELLNYLIYQDSIQVINKWGIVVKNTSINIPPKQAIVFGNQKSIALIYTNKVYIVNI